VNLLRCVDVIINQIGEGGFGSVYLCFNGKKGYNNLYAVKCIKSSESINSADRERRFGNVSKLNSDYLVKYYETFTFNNDLYVVMQYFKDGNLNDFIKRYREANQGVREYVYFYFI
jgi:serine/threonine protein kinase